MAVSYGLNMESHTPTNGYGTNGSESGICDTSDPSYDEAACLAAYQEGFSTEYAANNALAMYTGWNIYCGSLVFFMHAGFTLLECGWVQRKNQNSIIAKNLLALCAGAIGWFMFGYGAYAGETSRRGNLQEDETVNSYGEAKRTGGFIGTSKYWADEETLTSYNDDGSVNQSDHRTWYFQFTFCATAATIVSGALAERVTIEGFAILSFVMTSLIYPVVAHWTWNSDGMLAVEGYNDFAGSGTVHMTGGFAGLAASYIVGPRKGAFGDEPLRPTSMVLTCLGTFILWFGWYGFNCGSAASPAAGEGTLIGRVAVTTTISAASGGMMLFALNTVRSGKYDVGAWCNGILAGLVSITAGCSNTDPSAAFAVGATGAIVCEVALEILKYNQIDDPIGAFPVHGAAGAWGVMAAALFDMEKGVLYGEQFKVCMKANVAGVFAIGGWAVAAGGAVTLVLHKGMGIMRVPEEVEDVGLDSEFNIKHTTALNC